MMKRLSAFSISVLLAAFVLVETPRQVTIANAGQRTYYVQVKYRPTPVDIAHPRFKYLDTSRSSFINGAWYDQERAYMIIRLRSTFYHYCRMPMEAWETFNAASSFGRHYNAFIKGRFDCRLGGVPEYGNG
jgi:hypothetical protein